MHLTFPRSMVIPEVLKRLEDANFEDWLTAALIERASWAAAEDQSAKSAHQPAVGITDLWMLEMAERTGKIWNGKVQVELDNKEKRGRPADSMEQQSGELSFTLDTQTAEITFQPVIIAELVHQVAISR
jgi:hypothetical protein